MGASVLLITPCTKQDQRVSEKMFRFENRFSDALPKLRLFLSVRVYYTTNQSGCSFVERLQIRLVLYLTILSMGLKQPNLIIFENSLKFKHLRK
jgi:hypothetical protein